MKYVSVKLMWAENLKTYFWLGIYMNFEFWNILKFKLVSDQIPPFFPHFNPIFFKSVNIFFIGPTREK